MVWLCGACHQSGPLSAHRCRETADGLKALAQIAFEKSHTREEFMQIFGRNYCE